MTEGEVMTAERAANVLAAAAPGGQVALDLTGVSCCPGTIVPIVALADFYRMRGVDVSLKAYDGTDVARTVEGFSQGRLSPDVSSSLVRPFDRVWRFSGYDEQNAIVNAMTLQLGKCAALGKGVKESFIWCLNEVMDNVMTHASADGSVPGYAMVRFEEANGRIKVCVFDLGIGLKASFEGTEYAPADDYAAIVLALKANVTSGIGQGNGLWGLHELIRRAEGGSVSLASGGAAYMFSPKDGCDGPVAYAPLAGFTGTTLVDFRMTVGGAIAIDEVFADTARPVDLWQEAHETESGAIRYRVLEIAGGSGTRPSAAALRHLVENAIDNDGKTVMLDFDGVAFCSSAFIDELVGKLVVRYGFFGFTQKIRLLNVKGLSAQLLDHSIAQRLREG